MLQERFSSYYEMGMLLDLAMERGAKIIFDPAASYPMVISFKGQTWEGFHNGNALRAAQYFIDRIDRE